MSVEQVVWSLVQQSEWNNTFWTAEVYEVFRIHLFGVITASNEKFDLDAKQNYPRVEFAPSMLNEVHAVQCYILLFPSALSGENNVSEAAMPTRKSPTFKIKNSFWTRMEEMNKNT